MADLGRREALFAALFAALGAGAWLLPPSRSFARLAPDAIGAAIPRRIGPYEVLSTAGLILPPEDEMSRKLYDAVLTRVYVADGLAPVMALFAYGSTQNLTLQLHRPDECYPMQGFAMTRPVTAPVDLAGRTVPAAFITATRDERVEQVLYWSRIGTVFPPDRWTETWIVAKDNLRGTMPDGFLVRLSVIDPDRDAALGQLRSFSGSLMAALPPAGRRLMLGDA